MDSASKRSKRTLEAGVLGRYRPKQHRLAFSIDHFRFVRMRRPTSTVATTPAAYAMSIWPLSRPSKSPSGLRGIIGFSKPRGQNGAMRTRDARLRPALNFSRNTYRPSLRPQDHRSPRRVAWRQQSHTELLPVLFVGIAWDPVLGRIEQTRNRSRAKRGKLQARISA